MWDYPFLLMVLVHYFTLMQGSHACDVDEFSRCQDTLLKLDSSISLMALLPTITIDGLCSDLEDVRVCVRDRAQLSNCHPSVQAVWDGEDQANQYLCETFDESTDYIECFGTSDISTKEDESCTKLEDLWTEIPLLKTTDQNVAKCHEIDDYITCTADVAVKYCGADAGAWQRKYAERMQGPVKQYLGCQTAAHDLWFKVRIGAIVTGVLFVIGVLCGIIIKQRSKKKANRPDDRRTLHLEESC